MASSITTKPNNFTDVSTTFCGLFCFSLKEPGCQFVCYSLNCCLHFVPEKSKEILQQINFLVKALRSSMYNIQLQSGAVNPTDLTSSRKWFTSAVNLARTLFSRKTHTHSHTRLIPKLPHWFLYFSCSILWYFLHPCAITLIFLSPLWPWDSDSITTMET